ncbi:UNVERIFIED_ORG: hypothetical protein ABIC54_006709 [Burkholderia sp. 1263]
MLAKSSSSRTHSFGVTQIGAIVVAVVAAILMQPEISAAIASMSGAADAAATAAFAAAQEGLTGAAITAAASAAGGTLAVGGLANTMIAVGLSSFASSALSQVITTGSINIGAALRNGLIGAATAGLTNGITFDTGSGSVGFNVNASVEGVTAPSLANLAGIQNVGNTLVPQAGTAAGSLPTEIAAIASSATIQAGLQTVIGGGSFLDSLKNSLVNDAAAAGAFAIGNAFNAQQGFWTTSNPLYAFEHAALGCAAGAAGGTGCAGGAIGGATSAVFTSQIPDPTDSNGNPTSWSPQQVAALTAASMLLGGTAAGLLGQNAVAGAMAAENETQNNRVLHPQEQPLAQQLAAAANAKGITKPDGSPVTTADVSNQLAQMGYRQNGVTESGTAATVTGAYPNDGSTWLLAGVNANTGQTIWAQVPGSANPTLQTFILQNTNGADVPLAQSYTASPSGAQSNLAPQGVSMGSSAGSICPNGNCGIAYQSVSMPPPAALTDKGSTALALASPWLPPPFDVAALVGSAGLQSLNYLYSPPSRASVLYVMMSTIGGALLPQGPMVQTLFTLGTTAAQPYIAP